MTSPIHRLRFRDVCRQLPFWIFCWVMVISPLFADPPPGYYNSAIGLTGTPLRNALHEIIDDHFRLPYTSSSTDTWDVIALADADQSTPGNILTIYRNESIDSDNHTQATGFNREHTWPTSYGFTENDGCNYPFTDLHQLAPATWDYNTARGNRVFDFCFGSCDAYPVVGVPSEANYGTGSGPFGSWEVWSDRRGDIARRLLYLAIRYEGDTHGITGCAEPDLLLTNNRNLIIANTSQNYSPAYMGELTILLQWHLEDPVDTREEERNDIVFSFQGNRNPFVDHPEWACLIWSCPGGGDMTPPAAPTGVFAIEGDCSIILSWSASPEVDLDGYQVQRASAGSSPTLLTTTLLTNGTYLDTTAQNGVSYTYFVEAVDLAGNVSDPSLPTDATPNGVAPCGDDLRPWINELHYDISGALAAGGVEIAAPLSTSLTGWFVVVYDGGSGSPVTTVPVDPQVNDLGTGFGVSWSPFPTLSSSGSIGFALIDDRGDLIEFLSCGGVFTAATGAAAGATTTDTLVAEDDSTLPGTSLQLVGSGTSSAEFDWVSSVPETSEAVNLGQTIACPAPGTDCDLDGWDDACEIAAGLEEDQDFDGIPDSCQGSLGFLRGDGNLDGALDISDAVFALSVLFSGQAAGCQDALDSNDDGNADIGDSVFLLSFFFSGGAIPPPPNGSCGSDPTPDALNCADLQNCP